MWGFVAKNKTRSKNKIPSRELTYPTLGKGKSSSKYHFLGDMLVPWRVSTVHFLKWWSINSKIDIIKYDPQRINLASQASHDASNELVQGHLRQYSSGYGASFQTRPRAPPKKPGPSCARITGGKTGGPRPPTKHHDEKTAKAFGTCCVSASPSPLSIKWNNAALSLACRCPRCLVGVFLFACLSRSQLRALVGPKSLHNLPPPVKWCLQAALFTMGKGGIPPKKLTFLQGPGWRLT